MRAGVIDTENNEVLNGSGTARHHAGPLNASGILTRAVGGGSETNLEAVGLALADLRTGARFVEPDGIVLPSTTFSVTRRTKDGQHR
jgi:hypothetical protein